MGAAPLCRRPGGQGRGAEGYDHCGATHGTTRLCVIDPLILTSLTFLSEALRAYPQMPWASAGRGVPSKAGHKRPQCGCGTLCYAKGFPMVRQGASALKEPSVEWCASGREFARSSPRVEDGLRHENMRVQEY